MNALNAIRSVGLLLAAGAGTRFGGAYPGAKLDRLIDGVAVGVRAFDAMFAGCDATVVVVRSDQSALAQHARSRGARVVVASAPDRGMGHSIAEGVSTITTLFPNARMIMVSMADMPWIDTNFYRPEILNSWGDKEKSRVILQYRDRVADKVGHPVAFGRAHWPALAALAGDRGARAVIEANPDCVIEIAVDDSAIWRDVDTPEDLSR
jgi:molybdenum cofactor cytidylyltransferase